MSTNTQSQDFKVKLNDVVVRIRDNAPFIIKEEVANGYVPASSYRFDRAGTAADATLPTFNKADYVVKPAGSTQNASKAMAGTAASIFEEKINKVNSADELFTNLNGYAVLDVSKFGDVLAKPAVEPGLLDLETTKAISLALRSLQSGLMNDTSNEAVSAFLLAFLQNLVTYYTSPDLEVKEGYGTYVGYGDKPLLLYGAVKHAVNNAVAGKNVENALRQYARLFTATVINLANNGKLQLNTKVLAQHGVVKRFAPYCLDFVRPNYATYNTNQIRAWQLAQQSAFARKSSANSNTLHNTSELSLKN